MLKQVILYTISVVILLALGSLVEWSRVGEALAGARPMPLLAAFLLTLLFPVLNMLRWQAVLLACGIRLPDARAFSITMACWPVGTLTPGKAGELLKGVAVPDKIKGMGSVIAERVIDVAVLGTFGLIFGLLVGNWWAVAGGAFGWCAAIGVVSIAAFAGSMLKHKPIGEKLRGLMEVFPLLLAKPALLTACVLASALNWFLSMAQLWYLLEAFQAPTSLALVVAILPAATFAGLLPLTPAGVGTRDGALLFLAAGRIDAAALLASSIVYSVFGYFMLGAAGLPFLHHELRLRGKGAKKSS